MAVFIARPLAAALPDLRRGPARAGAPTRVVRRPAPSAPPPAAAVGRRLVLGGQVGTLFVEARLGQGSYGTLWAVRPEGRSGAWAVKIVPLARLSRDEQLRAAQLQRRCAGPWVLAAQTPHFVGAHGYTLMRRVMGPSLEQWALQHRGGRLPAPLALALWRQMLAATAQCHGHGVVHQDLKPDNFLCGADDRGVPRLQLTDFDTAREILGHAAAGTVTYLAPEALAGAPASYAMDVWALGVGLFRLLVGLEPYDAATEAETLSRLRTNRPSTDLVDLQAVWTVDRVPRAERHACLALLEATLQRNPRERASLAELRRLVARTGLVALH